MEQDCLQSDHDVQSPPSNRGVDADDTGQKVCRVCGDKALGFNFNVITCESCKAFFRRNALKDKPMVCHFSNNCDVNPVSRRFCQKCRLQKCFAVGMKKEAIVSEDVLMDKRAKLNASRKTKRPAAECISTSNNSYDNSLLSGPAKKAVEDPAALCAKAQDHNADNLLTFAQIQSTVAAAVHGASDVIAVPRGLVVDLMNQLNSAVKTINNLVYCTSCGTRLQRRQSGGTRDFNSFSASHESEHNNVPSPLRIGQQRPSSTLLHSQAVSPPSSLESSPGSSSGAVSAFSPASKPDPAAYSVSVGQFVSPPTSGPFAVAMPGFVPLVTEAGSAVPPVSWPSTSHEQGNLSCLNDNFSTVIDAAIASEFTECCPAMGLPDSSRVPGFTDVEQSRFDELLIANEVMNEPIERIPESQLGNVAHNLDQPRLIDVMNMTDIVIKRMIRMSKQLAGFQSLCQEDQIALLKGGCTEIMILRGVMRCDPEKNTWNGPFSQIKMEILKEAKGRNFYEDHAKFIRSLKPSVRTCEPVMLLMGAICLFTPTRLNVVNAGGIKNEQDMYFSILNKYLESQYPSEEEAGGVYSHVIQKIEEVHKLNEQTVKIFLDANPKELEPLLIEIFDLK